MNLGKPSMISEQSGLREYSVAKVVCESESFATDICDTSRPGFRFTATVVRVSEFLRQTNVAAGVWEVAVGILLSNRHRPSVPRLQRR